MKIRRFSDYQVFLATGLKEIEDYLSAKIAANNWVSLGLCGGKTPVRLFTEMGKSKAIDWPKVRTLLVDDRYVPHNDTRSNYAMVKNAMFDGGNADLADNLKSFDTSLSKELAVVKYQQIYEDSVQSGLDLAILGAGVDGHFGAIFPGYIEKMKDFWGGWTETEQFEVRERLTLSPKTIKSAKKIIFWLAGPDKQSILDEIEHGQKSENEFPIKYLANHPDLEIFYCESAG